MTIIDLIPTLKVIVILENNNLSISTDSFQLFPSTLSASENQYNWRIIKSFPNSEIIIQQKDISGQLYSI